MAIKITDKGKILAVIGIVTIAGILVSFFIIPALQPGPFHISLVATENVPLLTVIPLQKYAPGDQVHINGTTSLPAGEVLDIALIREPFHTTKCDPGTFCGSGTYSTRVSAGSESNVWSYNLNTTGFPDGGYDIWVVSRTRPNTSVHTALYINKSASLASLQHSDALADSFNCPRILTQPPEKYSCPRDMFPLPSTYPLEDPGNITQAEADGIPVDFPGVERSILVSTALKDPCVIEFLKSGGEIAGIIDQPRPTTGKETVRWPPTLMTYRRINCTEMFVFFDIDPSARNISRIHVEYR